MSIGPYTLVPIPLDSEGKGPEMEESKVVKTVYQVWDATCTTVFESDDILVAEKRCRELNSEHTKSS